MINSRKKFPLYGYILNKTYAKSLRIFFLVNFVFLLLLPLTTKNLRYYLLFLIFLLIVFFYSAKPIRLKEKPPLDSLSTGLLFIILFVMGLTLGGNSLRNLKIRDYFLALSVSGIHALATIVDYDSDKKVNHKTFSVVFGRRNAALFAFIVFLITNILTKSDNPFVNLYTYSLTFSSLILIIKPEPKYALTLLEITSILLVIAFIMKISSLIMT